MNAPERRPERAAEPEEPPPFLSTWRRVYWAVIGWLAFLILVFYAFTRKFAP